MASDRAHGREETALISADEYRRLTRRQRRPFLIENLPDEDWLAIEQTCAELKQAEDEARGLTPARIDT